MNRVPLKVPDAAKSILNDMYSGRESMKPTSSYTIMREVLGKVGETFNSDFCTGVDLNRNFPYQWGVSYIYSNSRAIYRIIDIIYCRSSESTARIVLNRDGRTPELPQCIIKFYTPHKSTTLIFVIFD